MEEIIISTKNKRKNSLNNKKHFLSLIPFFGLAGMILFFAISTNFNSVTLNNFKLIIEQSYVLLVSASGVFFIMTMGGLDFSQGSILAVASLVVAYFGQINLFIAIVMGIFVGAIIGAINGGLHAKAKIASFIVTICTMFIFRGVCAFITTDNPINAPLYMLALNKWYVYIPIVAIIIIVSWFSFERTRFGRTIRAIGAGETAARFSGIRIERTKFFVFMLSGAFTGLAATINTIRVGSIAPSAGSLLETNIMIALVLGGMPIMGGAKTRFLNVIVGCLMFGILNNGLVLLKIDPIIQQLIRGVVFLAIVVLTMDRNASTVVK